MQFRAKLRRGSNIYKIWFGASRIGGMISGVNFKRIGIDYFSIQDPLAPEYVSKLLHHPMVDLEVRAEPVGSVVVVPNDPADELPVPSEPDLAVDPFEKDALDALWRRDEPKADPVMRRRGRPPLVR